MRATYAVRAACAVVVCVLALAPGHVAGDNYHECIHDSISHKLGTPPVVYVPTAAGRTHYDDGLVEEMQQQTPTGPLGGLTSQAPQYPDAVLDSFTSQPRRHLVVGWGSIRLFIDTSRLSKCVSLRSLLCGCDACEAVLRLIAPSRSTQLTPRPRARACSRLPPAATLDSCARCRARRTPTRWTRLAAVSAQQQTS